MKDFPLAQPFTAGENEKTFQRRFSAQKQGLKPQQKPDESGCAIDGQASQL